MFSDASAASCTWSGAVASSTVTSTVAVDVPPKPSSTLSVMWWTPTAGLAVGVHHITLSVDDGFGGTSTATVDVTVLDATAPLQVQLAALASENIALTAQNQQLQQELAASQRVIADAVST